MTSSTTTTIAIALRRRGAPRVATTAGLEGFLDALGLIRARRNLDAALPTLVEAASCGGCRRGCSSTPWRSLPPCSMRLRLFCGRVP